MIRIDFDRRAESARHRGLVCRTPGSEPIYELARVLADRGWRGPGECFDERGMKCLTFRSILGIAVHYRPTPDERAAKAVRKAAEAARKN